MIKIQSNNTFSMYILFALTAKHASSNWNVLIHLISNNINKLSLHCNDSNSIKCNA